MLWPCSQYWIRRQSSLIMCAAYMSPHVTPESLLGCPIICVCVCWHAFLGRDILWLACRQLSVWQPINFGSVAKYCQYSNSFAHLYWAYVSELCCHCNSLKLQLRVTFVSVYPAFSATAFSAIAVCAIAFSANCLQCFDTVGWAAGRASGL